MPTLILTPQFTEDSQALWRAANDLGWQVHRLNRWNVPPHLQQVDEPVLHVDALFGPVVAEQLGLRLLEPSDDWLPALPAEYRKRAIALTTLDEARHTASPAFVKPPGDKSFQAGVYTGAELPPDFDGDSPVLTAEIVSWESEFRCFVLDRQLKTLSVYLRSGEVQRSFDFAHSPAEEAEVRDFISDLLADPRVDLPRATVIDVGVIEGRGWAVVEQNGAWAAGIYGCDPREALGVIRHAVIRH